MGESDLEPIGIDQHAERLYRCLLRAGRATTEQLAAELGIDAPAVQALASRLRVAGLVAALADEGSSYAPVDPRVAVRELTDQRTAQLDRIRAQVPVLAQMFDSARDRGTGAGATIVLADPDAIAATYVRVQHQAREQFLAFDRPPYVSAARNPLEPAVLDRGVSWRAVYAAASFEIAGAWDEARELAERGEQARVVPHLPVKLAIADRELALVSLQLDPLRIEALRTESRPLVEALCSLFEAYWAQGAPVSSTDVQAGRTVRPTSPPRAEPAAPGRRPSAGEQALLTLIGAGLKDDVIARQLGISSRTLRRRSQDLMAELGASNRFQAGAEAARRGWV